ncbi:MAG: glycosyltransferase family 4 protein [Chthoniobacter sp.]
MRILFVSNLYPPHHVGGYELGARDVVNALRARGHEVFILTSTFRLEGSFEDEPGVERALHFIAGDERHDKIRECRILRRALQRHRPDVVYFWNQAGLSYWLSMAAHWLGCRVAFFLSDPNFVSWRIAAWLAGLAPRSALIHALFGRTFLVRGWPVIQNRACHFASRFLQSCATNAGIPVASETSALVYWGIDPPVFAAIGRRSRPLRSLLYVGQLIPQKGVHTAIAALALLPAEPEGNSLTLTIVGGGLHPEYEKRLGAMPAELGIADRVHFLGKVPRNALPAIYGAHDVLVFPSEWEEPFAITPLEAMAAGLVVVGTTTGGSGELFRNRETAMTFTAGDAHDCARAIRELCSDPTLAESIRTRSLGEVTTRYTLVSMVNSIESGLRKIIADA